MLETSIDGAKAVLINITGGNTIGILEVNEAASLIARGRRRRREHHHLGAGIDETFDDEVRITVIATGFEGAEYNLPKSGAAAQPRGPAAAHRPPRPSRTTASPSASPSGSATSAAPRLRARAACAT